MADTLLSGKIVLDTEIKDPQKIGEKIGKGIDKAGGKTNWKELTESLKRSFSARDLWTGIALVSAEIFKNIFKDTFKDILKIPSKISKDSFNKAIDAFISEHKKWTENYYGNEEKAGTFKMDPNGNEVPPNPIPFSMPPEKEKEIKEAFKKHKIYNVISKTISGFADLAKVIPVIGKVLSLSLKVLAVAIASFVGFLMLQKSLIGNVGMAPMFQSLIALKNLKFHLDMQRQLGKSFLSLSEATIALKKQFWDLLCPVIRILSDILWALIKALTFLLKAIDYICHLIKVIAVSFVAAIAAVQAAVLRSLIEGMKVLYLMIRHPINFMEGDYTSQIANDRNNIGNKLTERLGKDFEKVWKAIKGQTDQQKRFHDEAEIVKYNKAALQFFSGFGTKGSPQQIWSEKFEESVKAKQKLGITTHQGLMKNVKNAFGGAS